MTKGKKRRKLLRLQAWGLRESWRPTGMERPSQGSFPARSQGRRWRNKKTKVSSWKIALDFMKGSHCEKGWLLYTIVSLEFMPRVLHDSWLWLLADTGPSSTHSLPPAWSLPHPVLPYGVTWRVSQFLGLARPVPWVGLFASQSKMDSIFRKLMQNRQSCFIYRLIIKAIIGSGLCASHPDRFTVCTFSRSAPFHCPGHRKSKRRRRLSRRVSLRGDLPMGTF